MAVVRHVSQDITDRISIYHPSPVSFRERLLRDEHTVDQFRSKEKFSLNINLAKDDDFQADNGDTTATTISGWMDGAT